MHSCIYVILTCLWRLEHNQYTYFSIGLYPIRFNFVTSWVVPCWTKERLQFLSIDFLLSRFRVLVYLFTFSPLLPQLITLFIILYFPVMFLLLMFPPLMFLLDSLPDAPPAAAERETDGSRRDKAGRRLPEDGEGKIIRMPGGTYLDNWLTFLSFTLSECWGDQHAAGWAAVQDDRVPPTQPRYWEIQP